MKILILHKSILINYSKSANIYLNNENNFKTILWLQDNLGKKKYLINNTINIVLTNYSLIFTTYKRYYFKYCVLFANLVKNSLRGLLQIYKIYLSIKGLGFKVYNDEKSIIFKLGFSHSITYTVPQNVQISVFQRKNKAIKICSSDLQFLKETVSVIQNFKLPNSYKYQGIFLLKSKKKLKSSKKLTK